MRYQYFRTDNKVICVSRYAGKTVRGVSKCFPTDDFNLEKGKHLAQLRCDVKIAEKRFARANQKYNEALVASFNAQNHVDHMADYLSESHSELIELKNKLMEFEANLK